MNFVRTMVVAFTALARTKTRSILTMLGVIIGVGAVIAMVSVGEGAKRRVAAQFEAMGTSTLIVSGGSSQAGGARGGAGSRLTLTWDDLTAIQGLPEVAAETVAAQSANSPHVWLAWVEAQQRIEVRSLTLDQLAPAPAGGGR